MKWIRIRKTLRDIKIIAVTASADPKLRPQVLAMGADRFLLKGAPVARVFCAWSAT